MKRKLKAVAILASAGLCLSGLAISANAEETERDLSVRILTDGSEMSGEDKLVFDIEVQNPNQFRVDDVTLNASLPEGFSFISNETYTMKLAPNESQTYQVQAQYGSQTTTTTNETNLSAGEQSDTTSTTATTKIVTTQQRVNGPKTGNPDAPWAMLLLLAGAGFVAFRSKHRKKMFTLIVSLVSCATFMHATGLYEVLAATNRSTTVSKTFKYDGTNYALNVTASYTLDGENPILIDTTAFSGPGATGIYLADSSIDTLNGSLKKSNTFSSLSYQVKDIKDYVLDSGELDVAENWQINDLGLGVGSNLITLSATSKDGAVYEKTVPVINTNEENMTRTNADLGDTDQDGLNNYFEFLLDTDPNVSDTDDDGLTDIEEFAFTGTDGAKADSDNNGISDADEDADNDGLTTDDELNAGTGCFRPDTDDDGLSDGDEVKKYGTDPLKPDTDADGMTDAQEIDLGTDPLKVDSDGNGISDNDEITNQTKTLSFDETNDGRGVTNVSVTLNVPGHIDNQVKIQNLYHSDARHASVAGLVGVPVSFETEVKFDTAEIRFTYDETALGETDENNLRMLWYNEEEDIYVPVEAVVDTASNTVTYTTTHFSDYMLVDKEIWLNAICMNINYRSAHGVENYDMALVVDVSGSMYGQRIATAKSALNVFIDAMMNEDKTGLVSFNSYAHDLCDLTNNRAVLKAAVASLSASGGTYAVAGIRNGINMLKSQGGPEKDILVLICDGDIYYDEALAADAAANGITMYCINVVNGSSAVMQHYADATGGAYYYAPTNNDIFNTLSQMNRDTVSAVDPTDSDTDGLFDVYEVSGMLLPTGNVIRSNPNVPQSLIPGIPDLNAVGGQPRQHQFNLDGQNYTFEVWHAPNMTLPDHFMYVNGKENTDGTVNYSKMNYMPYSNAFYNRNYVKEIEAKYKDNEPRIVHGGNGVYNSFGDKCAELSVGDCLKYASFVTAWTVIIAGIGLAGSNATGIASDFRDGGTTQYYHGSILAPQRVIVCALEGLEAAYCFLLYTTGNGCHNVGLTGDSVSTREVLYASVTVDQNLFGANSAYNHMIENLDEIVRAGKSVLNDFQREIYIAIAPSGYWTGCMYNDIDVRLDWDYIKQVVSTICNLSAFGIYNKAEAGAVLHMTYNPDALINAYSLEFNYYIIDYYDFESFDTLNDMNMLGLARSYELYGLVNGEAKLTKNQLFNNYTLY